jgi:hypothetical protein
MASKAHEAIQSAGVILSLALSAVAIWLSWSTYRLNNEDVKFSVRPSGDPTRLLKWTDRTRELRYLLDRRYTVLLANLSTQSTSIISMFAHDSRPGADPSTSGPSLFEAGVEKPFHPIPLAAGESKEFDIVYREIISKECGFTELSAASVNLANWHQITAIFDAHKRTFPFCDPFPNKPASITHEHIVFSIETARGLRRVATSHEIVEFNNEGKYDITTFTLN